MKRTICIFLLLGAAVTLEAQQQPQFTQYMFNTVTFNPATAGLSGAICATGFGRSQWMGYQDEYGNNIGPASYGLSFDMPVYAISSGAGLSFRYDRIGYERNLDARLHYAFHRVFSKNQILSFGLSLGMINKSIDYAGLHPGEPDPSLPSSGKESGTMTDFDLGVHYKFPRKFYAGFSVANLLGSSTKIGGPEYQLARHYYLMAGYDIFLEQRRNYRPIMLTPGFLLKATSGAVKVDIHAILTYDDFLWGGVVYRIDNAIGVMAGVKYYGFSVGVAYDYTLNANFGDGRSSMEFFVKYCYPIFPGIVKKSGYNTRNL